MMGPYRRFITSSVGFSFVVVGATGVLFKFFFKTHVLEQIHGWLGLAMVVAALLHMAQNWRPLSKYLRDAKVLSLLVPIVVVIAFLALKPEDDRRGANPKQVVHRLTDGRFADVARAFGKDAATLTAEMEKDGIAIESDGESLETLAKKNHRTADALLAYFIR